MKALLGIPDDTPENTVKNIKLILQEEVEALGASFECRDKQEGIAYQSTIDIELNNRQFRIFISWVNSYDLWQVSGTKGNGGISEGKWDLELLYGEEVEPLGWNPKNPRPPFRWGLFPRGSDVRYCKPTHILDGTLLRKLLHDALFPLPPASP